jgi:hypothetical protein
MNRLDALKTRVAAAQQEVYALCEGKHRWTMTVPVQPTDSDEVIGGVLDDIERLVAVVEAALDWDAAENYGHLAELQGVFEEAIALRKTLAYWLEEER